MKNKNKNIARFFSEKLPDPEIPADDAWGQMSDMLAKETAGAAEKHTFKGHPGNLLKLLSGLTLLGLVTFAVLVFLEEKGKTSSIAAKRIEAAKVSEKAKTDRKISKNIEKVFTPNALSSEKDKTEKTKLNNVAGEHDAGDSGDRNLSDKNLIRENVRDKNVSNKAVSNRSLSIKTVSDKTVSRKKKSRLLAAKDLPGKTERTARSKRENGEDILTKDYKRPEEVVLLSLKSSPFKPAAYYPGLSGKVNLPTRENIARRLPKKFGKRSYEIGLEWNLNSPLKRTEFLFTGMDSIRKPALLLLPGIYFTKSILEKHSVTLNLSAYQPYFANNGRLQVLDSIPGPDSSYFSRNTNLIKTAGFSLALQYQYQFVNHFAIAAGLGYNRVAQALIHTQTLNGNPRPLSSELVELKGSSALKPYLNQDIFYFKAGVSYKIGRFQTGMNILAPVNNVSALSQFPIRAVNGQFYLRFRVW